MQRDEGRFDALFAQRTQQGLIEMEPRSRRRDRASALGIDRLVAFAVSAVIRPVYIRRQWHVSDTLEERQHLLGKLQFEQRIVPSQQRRLATAVEMNLRAGLRRLARANVSQHTMAIQHALDQYLELSASVLLAEQARRDHTGIVEHHQ